MTIFHSYVNLPEGIVADLMAAIIQLHVWVQSKIKCKRQWLWEVPLFWHMHIPNKFS